MLYLARRRGVGGFSRLVALKLVHSHLMDDAQINRLFLQEARIAANIAHPNVVNVEEVGSADGKYFIAMEYVHGVSLDELLATLAKRRLRMSPKLCVWVAAQIGEALHAVHEATRENGLPLNIVHRDVSPQNVLVGHNGHIKLIDFGIAKSQLASHQVSSRGSVIGKLRYMAPEQLRMQPVTRRTDVYALGVMLWEMLAARNLLRCFRIDDERDWTTREHPPAPSTHASNVTQAIDQAVLRALACDPAARYEGALSFRAALLRAEPSASQVDAPQFAGLIRNLLGEELDKRRADWPSEVKVQLDSAVEGDTDRSLNLEELTARLRGEGAAVTADGEEPDEPGEPDEPDEPTLCDSPSALRLGREEAQRDDGEALELDRDEEETAVRHDASVEETVVRRPHVGEARALARALARPPRPLSAPASPQALIPTISAPPSTARAPSRIALKAKMLLRRAGVPGTAALALCVALFAYLAGSAPRLYYDLTHGSVAPRFMSRVTAQPHDPPLALEDGGPRLKLHETHIVSTVHTDEVKRPAARPQFATKAGKRTFGQRGKALRAKGKPALGARNKRPRP